MFRKYIYKNAIKLTILMSFKLTVMSHQEFLCVINLNACIALDRLLQLLVVLLTISMAFTALLNVLLRTLALLDVLVGTLLISLNNKDQSFIIDAQNCERYPLTAKRVLTINIVLYTPTCIHVFDMNLYFRFATCFFFL